MNNSSKGFVRSKSGGILTPPEGYGYRSENGIYYPQNYRQPTPRRLETPQVDRSGQPAAGQHPRVIFAGMFENRSFHHTLGGLNGYFGSEFHGVDYVQPGKLCWRQDPSSGAWVAGNPEHSYQDTMEQLDHIRQGHCAGFVANFQKHYPNATAEDLKFIMSYFPDGFLKAYHTLAKHGVVFDSWHASFRGPTWPNRWMHLAGTTNGYGNMPGSNVLTRDAFQHWFKLENDTIFTRLRDAGIPFRVYYHDTPVSMLLRKHREPSILAHYFPIEQLWEDLKKHPDDLPYLIYFEPCYQGPFENDGHPPQDIWKTDFFISKLYNAVRANPELWKVCAMLFMWDEHGGFFDPINPPTCVQPDAQQHEDPCIQLGLRVPTLLVSPLVPHGYDPAMYENCSWLTYMLETLGLPTLTKRTEAANTFGGLFEIGVDNEGGDPWPLFIDYSEEELEAPDLALEAETAAQINHLHSAYMHGPQYFELYRLPRVGTNLIRRWNSFKLSVRSLFSSKLRHEEGEAFHYPGIGTYTDGKDGVEGYEEAKRQTELQIKRAKRQHAREQRATAKKARKDKKSKKSNQAKQGNAGGPNASTGETNTRGI